MSTEQDKDKTQMNDEKFIDELYAQLEEETATDEALSEHPSCALDNKILSAAHQSVNSTPKVVGLERKTDKSGKKNNKPRVWYTSVGLAASTLLAVSLVVNQGEEVLVSSQPDMEIMSLSDEVIVNEPITIEAEALVLPAKAKHEKALLAKKERMSLLRSRQAEKSMLTAASSRQQALNNNIAGFSMADTAAIPVQQLAQEKQGKKIGDIPWLTTAQYQLFLQQKYSWSLISESDSAYMLDIYNGEERVEQYHLSKAKFTITDFANNSDKKHLFQKIKLK